MSFIIHLDRDNCWNDVIEAYRSHINLIIEKLRPSYQKYLPILKSGLSSYRSNGGIICFENEILSISQQLNILFEECLILQLIYETHSACTSAVVKSNNQYVHVRTMDWELPDLKSVTINIQVYRNRIHLFDAVTWAGFVGIFTGIKMGKYTIALNYRRSIFPNLMENINKLSAGYYPNAFFIRTLLESDNNKDQVLDTVKSVKLVAPAYYSLLFYDNSSYLITRDRDTFAIKDGLFVQTNLDNAYNTKYADILYSFARHKHMVPILDKNLNLMDLITHIDQFPVRNEYTIYSVIMTPSGFVYQDL